MHGNAVVYAEATTSGAAAKPLDTLAHLVHAAVPDVTAQRLSKTMEWIM